MFCKKGKDEHFEKFGLSCTVLGKNVLDVILSAVQKSEGK